VLSAHRLYDVSAAAGMMAQYGNLSLAGQAGQKPRAAARLLVVDTQTCGSFMRANVSLGPPRHAAQLGAAGATHPAASNTCPAPPPSYAVPALDAGLLPSTRSLLKSRGTPSNASHASQRTWVCGRRKPGGRGQHAPPLTETHMRLSCRRHRRGQAARLRGGEAAAVGQRLAVHVRPDLLRGRHQERGHHHAPARAVQQPRRRLEVLRLAARARPGSAALGSASPDT